MKIRFKYYDEVFTGIVKETFVYMDGFVFKNIPEKYFKKGRVVYKVSRKVKLPNGVVRLGYLVKKENVIEVIK